ncbi:hypothetical protein GCM10022402_11340 [Salinactinospora qingdaonensis]|uniref:Uncharacterized protein n=1 Tax=Salinactinospora qingdaonensis TaxID=702744 RepID=A0ABP7F9K4_9ACTN
MPPAPLGAGGTLRSVARSQPGGSDSGGRRAPQVTRCAGIRPQAVENVNQFRLTKSAGWPLEKVT